MKLRHRKLGRLEKGSGGVREGDERSKGGGVSSDLTF